MLPWQRFSWLLFSSQAKTLQQESNQLHLYSHDSFPLQVLIVMLNDVNIQKNLNNTTAIWETPLELGAYFGQGLDRCKTAFTANSE